MKTRRRRRRNGSRSSWKSNRTNRTGPSHAAEDPAAGRLHLRPRRQDRGKDTGNANPSPQRSHRNRHHTQGVGCDESRQDRRLRRRPGCRAGPAIRSPQPTRLLLAHLHHPAERHAPRRGRVSVAPAAAGLWRAGSRSVAQSFSRSVAQLRLCGESCSLYFRACPPFSLCLFHFAFPPVARAMRLTPAMMARTAAWSMFVSVPTPNTTSPVSSLRGT